MEPPLISYAEPIGAVAILLLGWYSNENNKWDKELWQKANLKASEPLFDFSRRLAGIEPTHAQNQIGMIL